MSRMGHRPVDVPEDVEISESGGVVTASGPNGELEQELADGISIEIEDDHVVLKRRDDSTRQKSQHGLMRSLVENIITGVSEGFTKTLVLNGLGYRAQKQGTTLTLELGYSNPIQVEVPDNVDVEVPNNTTIKVSGIDNQVVGDFAAKLRYLRDPDPYNQKGIKYEDEQIRQKVGKAVGGEMEGEDGGAGEM
ncbi:MAG: 50S ribosomal protein L6 [bacterium]